MQMRLYCTMTLAAGLALSAPAYSAVNDGKATYEQSCINCHGVNGTGNNASDAFWKMKIPRLNGNYIQSKPDAELKNVILNGKRKMPPALLGSPETQHRSPVSAAQVPDLIAYIRTFKGK
jgi:mono/diheme cytochrome c family protein